VSESENENLQSTTPGQNNLSNQSRLPEHNDM
jgi:hypothetical protein